ncbi:effector binding domain-containing protein [Rhodococcus sp. BP-241]|uniref:effector binding domain-containing protein n=1 Tax=unclassified Rhodococcus (in: high G+C Gram-positive bacteria) TaxID=192944 RepID=UPI001C9A4851|nr:MULTISPECIES: effector binding domain-containing protein [unclassified Rhodococcus (in: high G+C Gram-positive bacteria)]MBY6706908.1 effector binding domain-containing protein [Rhodococcus sp. BP-241]MDQ1181279.1 putative transcriptional regulator YdeE [Rhodococcus sp. SORGH_AS_0301]
MTIEFVDLAETWVAGLPVRSPKRALGSLYDTNLERAWSGILNQDIGEPLGSVYTDFVPAIGSYSTQIVGYRVADGDVRRGHIVARVPAGRYAKFSAVGNFPQVLTTLWNEITHAEEMGSFTRAFTGEFEVYPHAYKIEMYVPVATPGSRGVGGAG